MNKILQIHAEWLKENGTKQQYNSCIKQSKLYSKQCSDKRQIQGYKRRYIYTTPPALTGNHIIF